MLAVKAFRVFASRFASVGFCLAVAMFDCVRRGTRKGAVERESQRKRGRLFVLGNGLRFLLCGPRCVFIGVIDDSPCRLANWNQIVYYIERLSGKFAKANVKTRGEVTISYIRGFSKSRLERKIDGQLRISSNVVQLRSFIFF